MKVINPRKPHNFEPHYRHHKHADPGYESPGCGICGASKRNLRMHPNEDDYR